MRTSIRTDIASDNGASRWLAGAASGALLIAALATLPALADEPGSPIPPAGPAPVTQVDANEDAGFEWIIGEPLEDQATEDEATDDLQDLAVDPGFEGVIGEPLEDEVVDGVVEDAASGYEGVIGEPLEDEVPPES